MKATEPLGLGWIIALNQDWGPYKKGNEFKVVRVARPNKANDCDIVCEGCVQCEGWSDTHCMTSDGDLRIFDLVSRTGIGTYREGRDLINIVGMI